METLLLTRKKFLSLFSVVLFSLFFPAAVWSQTDVLNCPAGVISGTQMSFSTENFSIVHAKGSSSNFAEYSPWRVYANNTVTFTGGVAVQRITSIVINASQDPAVTASANLVVLSGSGTASTSRNGNTVTINISGSNVKSIRLTPNAQTRWSSITINYELAITCVIPSNPNGEITPNENPSCEAILLHYEHGTGQPQSGVSYYWQISATGTSTTFPVSNSYEATIDGHYFVRAYNGTCWSNGSYRTEIPLVINNPIEITTDPTDQVTFTGGNATFSVSATGSGTLSYQWQERPAVGGSWTNVGSNSSSFTVNNSMLSTNGNRYRVLVTNSCGTVNSSVARLSVTEGPCVNENFEGEFEPDNWEFDGTTWGGQSCSGNDGVVFDSRGDFALTPIVINPETLTFQKRRSSNTTAWSMLVQVSTNASHTSWTTVETLSIADISTNCSSHTVDLTSFTGERRIRFLDDRSSGSHQRTIDDVVVTCAPSCEPQVIAVLPSSGPVNTEVVITGNNFTTSSTVTFGSVFAVAEFISATEIRAIVPEGASGPITVDTSLDCDSEIAFTFVDFDDSSCEGQSQQFTDLIISEITDHGSGAHSYIELFNGTGSAINLANYSVRVHNNGAVSPTVTIPLSGNLASNSVFIISIGGSNASDNYGGHSPNLINGAGGINNDDHIRLYRNSTWIDLWGDTSGNAFTVASKDYFYRRKNTGIIAPSTTWNSSDWISDTPVDYSDIGLFEFAPGVPPVVLSQPEYEEMCGRVTLTVSAEEGFSGGLPLAYQWFMVAPGTANWTAVTNSSNFNGAQSSFLTIAQISGFENYQFYCQVQENAASCFQATNAIKLTNGNPVVVWNGTSWSPSPPTINHNAIINGTYSTANGSFEAKSLVNNGTVTIIGNSYIKLSESLTNNASFVIENNGSLLQVCDEAQNSGNIIVHRTTSPMYRYDFTYWSSPVASSSGFTLQNLSPQTLQDKYFKWDRVSQNWETVLNGSEVMQEGFGYIVRAPQTFSVNTTETEYFYGMFTGVPTNGIVEVPVVGGANSWNLLGNPYPSAIHADDFLSEISNSNTVDGTIYLWAHNSAPIEEMEGDATYNYNPADYAAYNFTGGVSTSSNAETDVTIKTPTGFVASGQAFFIRGIANGNAVFNNSMRVSGSNNQFFRSGNPDQNKNRIWLNLTDEINGFNQILVGYLDGATNGLDRGFDGELLGGNSVSFYSILEDKKLTIQGKSLPFDAEDVVGLGYSATASGNHTIGIDHFDGIFNRESIYLEDKQLGIIHDLKQSSYSFNTNAGTFNNRFVLRYKRETLSTDQHNTNNQIIAYWEKSSYVFSSKNNLIEAVQVYDLTGKILVDSKSIGKNSVPIYLEGIADQVLLAKVTLETGIVTTIKILKL